MKRRRLRPGNGPARVAFGLSVFAVGGAVIASVGASRGWWEPESGLRSLYLWFGLAVAGALLGAYARFGRSDGQMTAVAALLVGAGFAAFLAQEAWVERQATPLIDASTDLQDPPQFRSLPIRDDLLTAVPHLGRPGYAELPPVERWRAVHHDAHPNLKGIQLAAPPEKVFRRAEALARARRWDIARADPAAGVIEATAWSRFFGLPDDLVIRIRPEGGGTRVDMRGVARHGTTDAGRNARLIRRFLRDLEKPQG